MSPTGSRWRCRPSRRGGRAARATRATSWRREARHSVEFGDVGGAASPGRGGRRRASGRSAMVSGDWANQPDVTAHAGPRDPTTSVRGRLEAPYRDTADHAHIHLPEDHVPLLYTIGKLTVGHALRLGSAHSGGAGELSGERRRGPRRQPPLGRRRIPARPVVPRHIAFWAKAEYFRGRGSVAGLSGPSSRSRRHPGRAGRRPCRPYRLRRCDSRRLRQATSLRLPERALVRPDGRLYRGRTGAARLAAARGGAGRAGGRHRHRESPADRQPAYPSWAPRSRSIRQAAGLHRPLVGRDLAAGVTDEMMEEIQSPDRPGVRAALRAEADRP